MEPLIDLVLLEPHVSRLRRMLAGGSSEIAAYMMLGASDIAADPWSGLPRLRLVSHQFRDIEPSAFVSTSAVHVTWGTAGYMGLLSDALAAGLVPAIVHTHPGSTAFFSGQDDTNEARLALTAAVKGVRGLASIVLAGDGSIRARLWRGQGAPADAAFVQMVGGRFMRWTKDAAGVADADHLDRQARLFGPSFNPVLRGLRIAIIGLGGTGSAVAALLARLGVGYLLLLDDDHLETTNLNRVHGSRRSDVDGRLSKVALAEREIAAADLGVHVVTKKGWVNSPEMRDALKSCDFVFGCTDAHSGRAMLNRLAHYYGIPVIDVGLRMAPAAAGCGHDINGRVTTLSPGRPCLLCSGVIDPRRAAEESLERADPAEFRRRKAEAYVIGGGDPAPAVVTFTTEMACVAVNEMVDAITGFRGADGMVQNRTRRFHAGDDRYLATRRKDGCPVCVARSSWGRADTDPFLGIMG
jgi:molybdopterin/thiamine biosynthesis adenylyltransferase